MMCEIILLITYISCRLLLFDSTRGFKVFQHLVFLRREYSVWFHVRAGVFKETRNRGNKISYLEVSNSFKNCTIAIISFIEFYMWLSIIYNTETLEWVTCFRVHVVLNPTHVPF
uniref:Uncharacterized protein n=1 Tax=Tremella fuciformis TaxID=64657 RepID=A0A2H4QBN2_9TREE|nr:hypothetical protein [Tremella fuciformis]